MKFRYREDHELKYSGVEWIGKTANNWNLWLRCDNYQDATENSIDVNKSFWAFFDIEDIFI